MSGLRQIRLLLCALAVPALVMASAVACEPAPQAPHNDNFAAPALLAGTTQGQATGTTTGATLQAGESARTGTESVWFHWTAPQSGAASFGTISGLPIAVEAYTGSTWGHLQAVGSDEGGSTAFRVAAGTAYSIRITGEAGGGFTLKWTTTGAPANDARASAAPILGSTGSVLGDATAATADQSDPPIEGIRTPATIWYRWTAPANGWYEFDTHGSEVTTALGVYTDASPAQLVDDSTGDCAGFNAFSTPSAAVKFEATSGASYLLMAGGSDAEDSSSTSLGGPIQLNWRPAASAPVAAGNDAFASPATISGTHGIVSGNTDGATAEPSEPAIDGIPARNSVWFSWTPPATGTYDLSTWSSLSDECPAALAIYTGSSLGSLKAVPSSGEGLGPLSRLAGAADPHLTIFSSGGGELQVHLVAGTTYRIAADRLTQPGPFSLGWDIPQAAPVIRSVTRGNGSIGVIWSPPANTAGSARSGYLVMAIPVDDQFDDNEPLTLPVTAAFATIHGLRNGTAYQVFVAAVNDFGPGDPAISAPVTPSAH